MAKVSLMHVAERICERHPDPQRYRHFRRSAGETIERLAAGILEHERHASLWCIWRLRPHRAPSAAIDPVANANAAAAVNTFAWASSSAD